MKEQDGDYIFGEGVKAVHIDAFKTINYEKIMHQTGFL